MHYTHKNTDGEEFVSLDGATVPVGKVVCVGRNYMEHIEELGNTPSQEPVLFMKPSTALVDFSHDIVLPEGQGDCQNEIELAFLIGQPLKNATSQECSQAIIGIALALDLTLRDLQTKLKNAGKPWERAKAFDGSCPISGFMRIAGYSDQSIKFALDVNGERRQTGDSNMMLHSVISLLMNISQVFTLLPGDVVLTGTPKGVAALKPGDEIDAYMTGYFGVHTKVFAL